MKGKVCNASLCMPLPNVKITVCDDEGRIKQEKTAEPDGKWHLESLNSGDRISFSLKGYVQKSFAHDELPGIVRLLDDNLIGYQDRLWFKAGDRINAYIYSPVAYRARLYRHGYRKECLLDLGHHPARCQQVPDNHFVATGLSWQPAFWYRIPTDVHPGLYSLLLEAETQEPFAIPMIVSKPQQDCGNQDGLLVLASTNTWQSYNIWGGRSRYRNFEDNQTHDFINLPSHLAIRIIQRIGYFIPNFIKDFVNKILSRNRSPQSWMFQPLSIKRPFTNCALEEDDSFRPFTNHLGAGEWRLLAWLEREGYPYDIVSGYELHCNPKLLSKYRCIILNTHCEYWTKEMYEGLRHFHEKCNGWILNISGNSIYREIEFLDDASSRCKSLSFKTSCADESQTLGVRFTMTDYATCAPYRAVMPEHWIFRGAPLPKSGKFGGASLNQNTRRKLSRYDPGRPGVENGLDGVGASGWETDKLCKDAPPDVRVVAKGLNPGGGADMVVREPTLTRGGMFSASSIMFSGCLLIDQIASTVIANALKKALSLRAESVVD